MGPFLTTPDEMPNIDHLPVWQRHNGLLLQKGNTANMMFKVPLLIEYISQGMTLLPGDVVSTGTPAGIGSARQPKVLMTAGDVIEIGAEGLGEQRSAVVAMQAGS